MNNYQLSVKKYPVYKDSGVDWLGDIPEHWQVKRLKDIKANIPNAFVDGPFGSNLKTEHFIENGEVYVIDSGYITSGLFEIKREFKTISNEHFLTVNRSQCFHNDIIISKIGANFGMSGILPLLDKPSLVSGNTLKLTINRKLYNLKFIHYQLLNLKVNGVFDVLVKGSAQPALSMGLLNPLPFTTPSLREQESIATYLDTKTAQCDRKIDLLTQKATQYGKLKQSLINETVTRGLDKSVPMKDSAIGEIPEHWEVKHLKNLAEIKGGKDSKVVDVETGGYPIYGSGGVFGRASQYLHNKPSVLLGRKGTIDKPLFVTEAFWSVDTMFYTDIKNNVYPKFFYYQCLTIQFGLYQYGSAVPSMAQNVLRQILFATPPLAEQKAIADYLDKKTAQIDQIIQTINTQIEKLKELRKTLINDVVTGKIKVIDN